MKSKTIKKDIWSVVFIRCTILICIDSVFYIVGVLVVYLYLGRRGVTLLPSPGGAASGCRAGVASRYRVCISSTAGPVRPLGRVEGAGDPNHSLLGSRLTSDQPNSMSVCLSVSLTIYLSHCMFVYWYIHVGLSVCVCHFVFVYV